MLCQMCSKREATFHYKSNENGHVTEKHLCRECAEKSGYIGKSAFSGYNPFGMLDSFFDDGADGLLGGMFGNMLGSSMGASHGESAVCPKCGMRFSEFLNMGRLGCANCYSAFSSSLYPTVKRIHGNTKHSGKFPDGVKTAAAKENKLRDLKERLSKAIEKQEYEDAAKLRDEIKALENNSAQDKNSQNSARDGE